jgi:outer membrane protein TolC
MSAQTPTGTGVPTRTLARLVGYGNAMAITVALMGQLVTVADLVAQEPRSAGAAPMSLTLAAALDYADGSNPTLRQATNSARLNGAEMRTTWLDQILPSAQLTLFNTSFTGNLQRQALDNFGNPIANPTADWNYFSQTVHNLGLTWRIQGPSLFQDHRRQALINQDRDLGEDVARTDLHVEIQRRYFDALEQRDLMRAEEALIDARRIDLDVVQRLFSLALKTRVDVLNAELEIEQQALALRRQRGAYERALLSLRSQMGLNDEGDIEIADEVLPIFDPVALDARALISRALEVNPAVARSDVAIESAQLALAQQNSEWWPEVSLGVDVYRRSFQPETAALFDPSIGTDLESQFRVGFSLPILNGFFRQSADRQRASIELSNQREIDRETRLQLDEAVRGALLDLGNEWESFRLSERSSLIAAEALLLAREEYRLGTRSFEDLRSSFQLEADTRRQVITARHAFYDALLALEAAVGAPIRELVPATATTPGV